MNFSFLDKYWQFFLDGAITTLQLSLCTMVIGVAGGIILAIMRLSSIKPFKWFAVSYIEFIRGTPLLVQLYIVFYGLPQIGVDLPTFLAGVIALSINCAAYVAEIFRGGIQSVDKGQMEAARSLGMSNGLAMRMIILPQALRNILPALGNELIVLIKESSIVSIIGIYDLMYNADTVKGNTALPFEPLIVAAVIYFAMTFTLSKLLGIAERRMKAHD
ncbi:amino acid ABC transporter permease [Paenibacillus sp. N1-5-1-14]|uniref:amino acid ABC transporter permease n=1 Tax=Paenibacillus radicibacter TaxID=2972488 RepID=UPI002158E411|nr:amino acid ABC transporter permease [Paenibacillus radicibacter]MCR8641326.1 amino acid ABC transporter permease [Paenibacillus radicibacter]